MGDAKPRPKWVKALSFFIGDDLIDEKYEFPMDGSDDELLDEIEEAIGAILCRHYGHEVELDQCGIPEHAYCVWCRKGVVDIENGD